MIIGIDPDLVKSGVATKHNNELLLDNMSFFELYDYLQLHKDKIKVAYIEAGYLNKSNWHIRASNNPQTAAAIGRKVGENHAVAKKIVEMCKYIKVKYIEVRPSRQKIDADMFNKITKYKGRTNQEQRDAAMLIAGRSAPLQCN